MFLIIVVVYYHSQIVYRFFEVGLSKPAVATMAEVSISPSDFSAYVLDGLFDSFVEETMTMLVNLTMKPTVKAGLFLITTWTAVMIKITE